nr:immunoglobulin light chain junction region [Macaca mulatta]MOV79604.1 immunoglobulin light chain junction region [Macaca mulatta]MOV81771.1 immunoglobulin light chain junction region [Macaca mulatta]MOV83271.1 immunoglobulin light chain junction region [Macaca mulatta]MOV83480.1 immunoglobulin light chain junction region [Macaca mulatta]
CQQYNSLPLSF